MTDSMFIVYNIGFLLMVVAAFFSYRVSGKKAIKMASIWVGIFAAAFLIVSLFMIEPSTTDRINLT